MRIITLVLLILVFSETKSQTKYQKDFDFYWKTINDNFAYFDLQKTNWEKVRTIYQPLVDTITTNSSFIQLLENANNELYNGHVSLNTNLASSNRLIPTGADLWVKYENKKFIITATRAGFRAEESGLKPGMQIVAFNGEPMEKAVQAFLPKSVDTHDAKMYEYAANMVLAGRHNTKREITVLENGLQKTYYPDLNEFPPQILGLVSINHFHRGVGYIRINNSLGDNDLIKAFDEALDSQWNTDGMIIDLTETPSGGNSTVARAIMSRFIEKEMPYQKHSVPAEEKEFGVKRSWIEYVSPRGRIYKKPLVVIVNRWTGSMGEGIAIGFDAMKRATIVGDKMAGLLGANYSFTLPETNIGFSFPAEKLFHVNGKPREDFVPSILVKENKNYIPVAVGVIKKR
jgi:C-terminal processing protease CtpA/Prc